MRLVIYISALLFLLSLSAFGAEQGGAHHETGVPIVVLYQTINVLAIILVLFFMFRKKLAEVLIQRKKTYQEKVDSAKAVVQQAEEKFREIKNKIEAIETEKQQTLETAQKQAEEVKKKIIFEAQKQAEQIKKDMQATIQYEIEKAKNELHDETLEQIIKSAQNKIEDNMSERKQKVLNKQFIEDLGA